MAYKKGEDRRQRTLFPDCIDDYVEATGGDNGGAGIGSGGWYTDDMLTGGNGGVVTINGGSVVAINGGSVVARGGSGGYGIGPGRTGKDGAPATLTLNWRDTSDSIFISSVNAEASFSRAFAIGETSERATLNNISSAFIRPAEAIDITEDIEHGTVQADKEVYNYSLNDRVVTLTVTPDDGYELETLTIATAEATEPSGARMLALRRTKVDYTEGSEPNTYSFVMPAAAVTVNATFKETIPTGVEDINVPTAKSGKRYNIMGQPVSNDYKGIVIEDGKKIIVR